MNKSAKIFIAGAQGMVGYPGLVGFDASKPGGTPCKLLDVSRMQGLGWETKTSFVEGLEQTYRWFLAHQTTLRS